MNMPTIEENKKVWDEEYIWKKNGDEWDQQAAYCNQPYEEWKESIVKTFIYKNINPESNVLEIGPGHGRWTEFILKKAKNVILVDLSPNCIDFCKRRFSKFKNISYYVNDGKNLNFIKDNSIDFIWSYDSFVHMEREVIESYFREFARILRINGKAVIHHPGRRNITLWLNFLQKFGKWGVYLYQILSLGKIKRGDGWRSNISKELIKKIAENNHLKVEAQINSWGENFKYNIKLYRDYISILSKK
jgi:ubiquinone/menaquinone biosynthesis C-methylase UbiE